MVLKSFFIRSESIRFLFNDSRREFKTFSIKLGHKLGFPNEKLVIQKFFANKNLFYETISNHPRISI